MISRTSTPSIRPSWSASTIELADQTGDRDDEDVGLGGRVAWYKHKPSPPVLINALAPSVTFVRSRVVGSIAKTLIPPLYAAARSRVWVPIDVEPTSTLPQKLIAVVIR